jgi:hypothetical protein
MPALYRVADSSRRLSANLEKAAIRGLLRKCTRRPTSEKIAFREQALRLCDLSGFYLFQRSLAR